MHTYYVINMIKYIPNRLLCFSLYYSVSIYKLRWDFVLFHIYSDSFMYSMCVVLICTVLCKILCTVFCRFTVVLRNNLRMLCATQFNRTLHRLKILFAQTISPTSSLFVSQRLSTYSQGTWRNFLGENVRSTPTYVHNVRLNWVKFNRESRDLNWRCGCLFTFVVASSGNLHDSTAFCMKLALRCKNEVYKLNDCCISWFLIWQNSLMNDIFVSNLYVWSSCFLTISHCCRVSLQL